MQNTPEEVLGESINPPVFSPNNPPIYAKCLTCPDFGATCHGFDLVSLRDIGTVRSFHREIKKAHGLSLKAIATAAPIISEYTVAEYFSNVAKDFKWTTVVTIGNALLSICGNRIGLPPIDHSCPAASSEYRNLLAAADLKLAAADLNNANLQAECDDLRRRLADADGAHLAQVAELQTTTKSQEDWLKDDVRFWRRFAFTLLGIAVILLILLLLYIGWDIFSPNHGLIRY